MAGDNYSGRRVASFPDATDRDYWKGHHFIGGGGRGTELSLELPEPDEREEQASRGPIRAPKIPILASSARVEG